MSLNDQPKRFQVNLLTAIVMMVAASGLVGLTISKHGWPLEFDYYGSFRNLRQVVLDVLINLEIVIVAGVACEYGISRRKAKQP